MRQTAKWPQRQDTEIMTGTIRLDVQGDYILETERGPMQARPAAGCLVKPSPGDLVLLAVQGGRAWILNVLECAKPGPTVIRCEDGLSLETGRENLKISGQCLELTAGREINTAAPFWSLAADRGDVRAREFSMVGRSVSAAVEGVKVLSSMIESTVKTVTQHFGRVFRRVDDLERVSAGQVRLDIDQSWSLQAGTCRLNASEKVKMDAPKIDLG